jgi:hypothetical protein
MPRRHCERKGHTRQAQQGLRRPVNVQAAHLIHGYRRFLALTFVHRTIDPLKPASRRSVPSSMPLLPPNALQALHSALATLQSHPVGLAINGLALALLGLIALRAAAGVASFVWSYFLRPGRNLKFYGAWAVVTGATDGIGKAYCAELAKKGAQAGPEPRSTCSSGRGGCRLLPAFTRACTCAALAAGLNLVLISRTESKLKEVAAELEGGYGVQARFVAADLSQPTPDTLARIAAALQGLEVRAAAGLPRPAQRGPLALVHAAALTCSASSAAQRKSASPFSA